MEAPPTSPWPGLANLPLVVESGGLINRTWLVGAPPVAVLQCLNPIFKPNVHQDIEAVTAHLSARGMVTPRLLPTRTGELCHVDEAGQCWRAMSYVPGQSFHKLSEPRLAAAAGDLVARWHLATDDLAYEFVHRRPLAHHTPHHMEVLQQALIDHTGHRLYGAVEPIAAEILAAWSFWPGSLDHATRVAHGDLKISNLRFDDAGQGLCLLDLDTMGPLSLDVELGDAWRSWCNRAAEDSQDVHFDLVLFEASARAYTARRPLERAVRDTLALGIERICLELSARFCADALNERYFGWNPQVAPTRGEHNLLRARGQLALARSVVAQRGAIERILRS